MSSANQSIRSPGAQMPALLIQPPRLVEVPTSGETVTTRSATSGASRTRSTKKRPNACWVDSSPLCSRPRSSGTAGGSATNFGSGRSSRRPVAAHSAASAESGSNGAHGSSGSVPSVSASCAYCSALSRAEWLAGWPSVGSIQPLIV